MLKIVYHLSIIGKYTNRVRQQMIMENLRNTNIHSYSGEITRLGVGFLAKKCIVVFSQKSKKVAAAKSGVVSDV